MFVALKKLTIQRTRSPIYQHQQESITIDNTNAIN